MKARFNVALVSRKEDYGFHKYRPCFLLSDRLLKREYLKVIYSQCMYFRKLVSQTVFSLDVWVGQISGPQIYKCTYF